MGGCGGMGCGGMMGGMGGMMNPQMMMMQQMAMMQQMHLMGAMAMMGGCGGCGSCGGMGGCMPMAPPSEDPEETQRILGRRVLANTRAAISRQAAREATRDDEEGSDAEVPPGASTNSQHANYRPADTKVVPGLTDKRFEGRLKLWFDDVGYGYLDCDEIKSQYPEGDVFLHHCQKRHFVRGDYVSFNVFLNYRGRPQATELRRRKDPKSEAKRAASVATHASGRAVVTQT
mmetsp:Transcript_109016/g.348032  ORF Transcript_109016/g.348032 Transcript_109016/m.348032 type:complete len:231 (-) Transcript_109016:249-941(-)